MVGRDEGPARPGFELEPDRFVVGVGLLSMFHFLDLIVRDLLRRVARGGSLRAARPGASRRRAPAPPLHLEEPMEEPRELSLERLLLAGRRSQLAEHVQRLVMRRVGVERGVQVAFA